MQILDGKTLSRTIISSLKPCGELHIILVGEDPHSLKYVALKQAACLSIGQPCTVHRLPHDVTQQKLLDLISLLNKDPNVTGYFIQLPLPKNLNRDKILQSISSSKDVDGLTPSSPFTPAVVRGVLRLLDHYHLSVSGKNAVIINDSKLIGQPLQKILETRNARITICNEFTQNLSEISRGADFLFSAAGQKGLVTPEYIKPGAVVVDIGGGDVDFANVSPLCSYITPTIGGVGPMTIACLLENLLNHGHS